MSNSEPDIINLRIMGESLSVKAQASISEHDARFTDAVHIKRLSHVFYNKIDNADMSSVVDVVNSRLGISSQLRSVIWLFLFAHGARGSERTVPERSVHAVSVFSRQDGRLTHRYFERDADGFAEVTECAAALSGVPNLDDIRLLHFAAFDVGRLPARSTVYEYKAKVWNVEDSLEGADHGFRSAILRSNRLGGAPAIGLHGDTIYTALRISQGTEATHCGNDQACPEGAGSCVPVPPRDSAGYMCQADEGGDAWVSIFSRAVDAGLLSIDDADFPTARSLVTELLPKTPSGRQLMAAYYIASPELRRDRVAIRTYVRALPSIRESLRLLLRGRDSDTVITEELRQSIRSILALHDDHRPIASPLMGSLVGVDWQTTTTRRQILRMLRAQ